MPDDPYQSSQDELVSDSQALYETGALLLPALADLYSDLYDALPGPDAEYPFRRVGGIGRGDTGPYPEMHDLSVRVGLCLVKVRTALHRSGQVLTEVAEHFAATDDSIRQRFEVIVADVDRQAEAQERELADNDLDNRIEVVDEDDVTPDAPPPAPPGETGNAGGN